jgi:hypothetical protein
LTDIALSRGQEALDSSPWQATVGNSSLLQQFAVSNKTKQKQGKQIETKQKLWKQIRTEQKQ